MTSLELVLAVTSLFSIIKMLTDSEHTENVMATFSYQEDSVHFPPELTNPALLAEVNHFSFQRFACSSLKRHSQHHLRLFLQLQVSQGNLDLAVFVQVVSFKPSPDPRVKEVTGI